MPNQPGDCPKKSVGVASQFAAPTDGKKFLKLLGLRRFLGQVVSAQLGYRTHQVEDHQGGD